MLVMIHHSPTSSFIQNTQRTLETNKEHTTQSIALETPIEITSIQIDSHCIKIISS